MFNLVTLLATAALLSLQSYHIYAKIDEKIELDNNLLPNDISPPVRRVPHKYVKISSPPPETVRFVPGTTLVLKCEVTGNPAPMVGWLKNGSPVTDFGEDVNEIYSPPSFSVGHINSKMVIRAASNGDIYTCVGSTGLMETSASTTVFADGEPTSLLSELIPMKPIITSSYDNIFQISGTSLTLPCRVYSPTKTQVYWIQNEEKVIYGNNRMRVLPSGDLFIKDLSWEDMGVYTCSAKNAFGKDVAETFLYPVNPE